MSIRESAQIYFLDFFSLFRQFIPCSSRYLMTIISISLERLRNPSFASRSRVSLIFGEVLNVTDAVSPSCQVCLFSAFEYSRLQEGVKVSFGCYKS